MNRYPLATAMVLASLTLGACSGPATSTPAPPRTTSPPTGCITRPSSCGYPDDTNTGVPAGTALTKSGSITASQSGQVIEGLEITGEINVTASNVTIRNVRVIGGRGVGNADWVVVIRPGAEGLTITDSELQTPPGTPQDIACVLNIGDTKPTLRRLNIHGCSAGVSSGGGVVEDSYIHDLSEVPGQSHIVGVASNGGGGITVRHNTILNRFPQTATVALYQDFGTQRDNLITQNLLAGGGYCFYGGQGPKGGTRNIRFVGNRLSRHYFPNCGSFGVVAMFTSTDPGNTFSGNIWDEDGSEVPL